MKVYLKKKKKNKGNSLLGNEKVQHILPLFLEKIFAFRSTFFIELVPFVIVSGSYRVSKSRGQNRDRIRIACDKRKKHPRYIPKEEV